MQDTTQEIASFSGKRKAVGQKQSTMLHNVRRKLQKKKNWMQDTFTFLWHVNVRLQGADYPLKEI